MPLYSAARRRIAPFVFHSALLIVSAAVWPAKAAQVRVSNEQVAVTNSSGPITVGGVVGQADSARPPRIHFLFLAVDKVSNLAVWNSFFKDAPKEQYRAYVHCKLESCKDQVKGSMLEAVTTVPSSYCTDLVSPMNQLISAALMSDGAPNRADKFAFVSESTLPAKPFSVMYSTLTFRSGSDFCVFPAAEWAVVVDKDNHLEVLPKVHQWITLERGHAEVLLADWNHGKMRDLMSRFHLNDDTYGLANQSFSYHGRNYGCLDEFWHFAALYGSISQVDKTQERLVQLPLFAGAPLRVSRGEGWQGECDTFVMWPQYVHTPGRNPFHAFYNTLDPKSKPHDGSSARPGWWDTISTVGLTAIRQSSFMFMRKFIDYPTLADGASFHEAYDTYVLKA
jgi:hypothetical protein